MNVCFLAGTLGRGGAERQLCFMLRALKEEGVNPKLLCLTKGEALEQEIRDIGVEVDWVGRSSSRPLRLNDIYRRVGAMRPSVIQSSHFYTNMYAGAVGRMVGIPSIGAIRSDLNMELRANPVFGKWHLKLPRHLIANSHVGRKNALAMGVRSDKIDLVSNVVDTSKLRNESKRRHNGAFTFLFAGRLVPVKRPELFIEMAARLSSGLPEKQLRFLILGDGNLRGELEAKAKSMNLPPDSLIFLGERPSTDEAFREADALVLTSKVEGTPNVVLEAMAHGVPVIATRVGGIPEVLPEARGVLVDPHNFDDLVQAARSLVVDTDLRNALAVEGRRYVESAHSVENLGKALTDIYSKVLARDSK